MQTTRRPASLVMAAAGLAALVGLAGLGACNQGGAAVGGTGGASKYELPTDISTGSADAKVVLVEYASITCPHCANFNNDVKPQIKAKYIDTGLVRFVFREFPTPPINLAMAGHMIARCAGTERRDAVLDTLFRQQQEVFRQAQGPGGPRSALLPIAAAAGLDEAAFNACLENQELLKVLADIRTHGIETDNVTGTPAIFINGERYAGPPGREIAFADIDPVLAAAVTAAGGTVPAAPAAPAGAAPASAPAAPAAAPAAPAETK
jgi:protein-disulfide isomerase